MPARWPMDSGTTTHHRGDMIRKLHVETRGARIAVHCAGKGPLALLVHGYPLDHRMWLDLLGSRAAEHRTLAAVDLRGHGCSQQHEPQGCAEPKLDMELHAADLAAVIHQLGGGAADLVGLSMGGYATLALAAAHPQLLRTMTLVDTRAGADTDAGRAGRDAAITTVVERGRSAIADAMIPKLLAPGADPFVAARIRTMIESQPVETIVADLRGLRDRPDRTAMLPGLLMPVLVVVGEQDAITPPAEAQAMASAIVGAKLAVVPRCGHMTPMEAPGAFAGLLSDFWTG